MGMRMPLEGSQDMQVCCDLICLPCTHTHADSSCLGSSLGVVLCDMIWYQVGVAHYGLSFVISQIRSCGYLVPHILFSTCSVLFLGLFSTVGDVQTLLYSLMFATSDDGFINSTTVKTFTTVSDPSLIFGKGWGGGGGQQEEK